MVEGFAPFFSQHPLQLNRIRVQGRRFSWRRRPSPSRVSPIYSTVDSRRSHFHTGDYKPLILTSRPCQITRGAASTDAIPLTILNFLLLCDGKTFFTSYPPTPLYLRPGKEWRRFYELLSSPLFDTHLPPAVLAFMTTRRFISLFFSPCPRYDARSPASTIEAQRAIY